MSEQNGHTTLVHLQSGLDGLAQLGMSFGGQRSLYTALGWNARPTAQDFLNKYLRQDIAARIIDIFPEYCWRQPPRITDDADADRVTPFEAAYLALATQLRLPHAWQTLDRLAGLGQYAVLLLGAADGQPLSAPVRRVRGVQYLAPYGQLYVDVKETGQDPQLPTFGQPLLYTIDLARRATHGLSTPMSRVPSPLIEPVHASRVIHFAEHSLDGGIYGLPRLERLYNRLDDLEKLLGGSAEMFWQAGRGSLVMALRDGAEPADQQTREDLTRQVDEWTHGLRQTIRVAGIDVIRLDAALASPKDAITAQQIFLSAGSGIPQRILFGSERGELSSLQDQIDWETTLHSREENTLEPGMVRPTIDRFIAWGVLPEPAGGAYEVLWPTGGVADPLRQAEIAERMAHAVALYVDGQGELVVPVAEFRERALGLPPLPDEGLPQDALDREDDDEEDEGDDTRP